MFVRRWIPEGPPKAAVQIAHGLGEHSGHYERLAEALTGAGYAVYAGDHRGHRLTARTPGDLGFFGERDGWGRCVADLWRLNRSEERASCSACPYRSCHPDVLVVKAAQEGHRYDASNRLHRPAARYILAEG